MILDTADLVDIVLHQLGVVELEVSGKGKKLSGWKLFCVSPVHGTLPKKLVMVVVLILTSLEERYEGNEGNKTDSLEGLLKLKPDLNHGEVLAVLGVELVVAALDDGELADVVVDRLLAGRCPLQQSETSISLNSAQLFSSILLICQVLHLVDF